MFFTLQWKVDFDFEKKRKIVGIDFHCYSFKVKK